MNRLVANVESAGRPVRVLVIDDEEPVRRNLSSGLEDLGYEVTMATDGREGLEVFERAAADIVLVDLFMPVMGGMEFIIALRTKSPFTPVVVVSGSGTLHDAIKAIRLGAWDYVVKPVEESQELDLILRRNLDRARLLFENQQQKKQLEGLLTENTLKLKESEERLRLLSDNLPDSMVCQFTRKPDGTNQFLHVSAGVELLNGLSAEAVLQDSSLFYNQIIEEDRPILTQAREEAAQKMTGVNVNLRMRRADGELRWMNLRSAPRQVPGGGIVWDGIETDITERKRAEEELGRLQRQHALILNSVAEGVHGIDLEGNIIFENAASTQMLGWNVADLLDRPAHETIHHSHPDGTTFQQHACKIYATLKDGLTRRVSDEVFWRKDGTPFPVEYFTAPMRAEDGKIVGVVVTFSDITERKRLEEQLRKAQKMEALGTLAGGTAHEFNNVLGIMIGYGELAKTELDSHHPVQTSLDEILQAGQRAKEIIQQILTFSRLQTQDRKFIQLHDTVGEAVKHIRKIIPNTVDIQTDIAADSSAILGNATQIHQVITNICLNAWHAMENRGGIIKLIQKSVALEKSAVEIHPALHSGAYLQLSIADNGKGMDAATLSRIFEPFFTTKMLGKGSGLGLAVVHGIMQSHEGAVVVSSQPGKGTTFDLYFPARPEAVVPPVSTQATTAYRGNGQHILMVDDEAALARVTIKFLQRLGYRTTEAHSAAEALAAFQKAPGSFDLVVTDLTMPDMNGIGLAKALYDIRPRLPVILISGFDGAKTAEQGCTPNIRTLLQKPIKSDALAKKIHTILEYSPAHS